ncbi:MAG: hypothetical protein M1834_006796 [Cirrosporium novae-zelandiae]|nr:MAG: hypothetical protein M1834_006796 [Cirrosporium novae-zelandiae]
MSANVVVIDSAARRAVIKVTPSTRLSDVRDQACSKFGLSAGQYELKNNKKHVALSNTYRLSGLPSGAKLELVQASRSPSVVSLAFQLPQSEAQGAPNSRLTDKFSSSTTLWMVLRKFESTPAPNGRPYNFTARGTPQTKDGETGAGRLFYETPVLNDMGKELSSFTDFQKTLAQLGYSNGSHLFRLSFRATDLPLEQAITQIDEYFKEPGSTPQAGAHAGSAGTAESKPNIETLGVSDEASDEKSPPEPSSPDPIESEPTNTENVPPTVQLDSVINGTVVGPDQRLLNVIAPSSSATPQAANFIDRESDHEINIEQAKLHQKHLQEAAKPTRLQSDIEIAAREKAASEKLASVKHIRIRLRFQDGYMVDTEFNNLDTAASLHSFVRGLLSRPEEPFRLSFIGDNVSLQSIPDAASVRLISGLRIKQDTLVNVGWDDKTSLEAKTSPVLREGIRNKGQEIKVSEPQPSLVEESTSSRLQQQQQPSGGPKRNQASVEDRLRKLVGFNKKR